MFEKVNPMHPDKVADRIAGAVVDIAYATEENPKIAVEVLIGHGVCHIIVETSAELDEIAICQAVHRITGRSDIMVDLRCVKQDVHLNKNQQNGFKCGDNGIFKGVPLTDEQKALSKFAREVYTEYPTDGKYILDGEKLVVCQSHARSGDLKQLLSSKFSDIFTVAYINPLGDWTGGTDVDTGATNRKLGSDMADSVTGGGLHGKDLSKADVSANIYAFRKAQETGEIVSLSCAIGDTHIDGVPYEEIVEQAREYIFSLGGFEKFAEWGLV
jgi:S-adenosylmethionine synthetase